MKTYKKFRWTGVLCATCLLFGTMNLAYSHGGWGGHGGYYGGGYGHGYHGDGWRRGGGWGNSGWGYGGGWGPAAIIGTGLVGAAIVNSSYSSYNDCFWIPRQYDPYGYIIPGHWSC